MAIDKQRLVAALSLIQKDETGLYYESLESLLEEILIVSRSRHTN